MNQTTTTSILLSIVGLALLLWLGIAGVASNPSYCVGTSCTKTASNIIDLTASVASITDGNYDSFNSPKGTYYLTTGILDIIQLNGIPLKTGGEGIMIGYADTTVSDDVTIPAGGIIVFNSTYSGEQMTANDQPIHATIPAGMYPFIHMTGAGAVQAIGILR